MDGWKTLLLALAPAVILLILLAIVAHRCCCSRTNENRSEESTPNRTFNLRGSHRSPVLVNLDGDYRKGRSTYNILQHGEITRSYFSWSDHPDLIAVAIKEGWPRFAFASCTPSHLIRSPSSFCLFCSAGHHGQGVTMGSSWRVPPGASERMQMLRFHQDRKNDDAGIGYAITALPLPGPISETSSFPQEAYFEITIWPEYFDPEGTDEIWIGSESRAKLHSYPNGLANNQSCKTIERDKDQMGIISMGLTRRVIPPLKPPGTYSGSIRFDYNGSVHLNGMKLVEPKRKTGKGGTGETVMGCGFDPRRRKIVFTLNSELVHVFHCGSEEFSNPLYPVLISTKDVTVLVNLGQVSFSYAPANLQRTPDPRLRNQIAELIPPRKDGFGIDSGELFLMDRIDLPWSSRSRNCHRDSPVDSEELFEIPLHGLSPSR